MALAAQRDLERASLRSGIGHIALALYWYDRTTGLLRDGHAFSGTMVLGGGFVLLGLIAMPIGLLVERRLVARAYGALTGLVDAAAIVGYTASRGYLLGGVTGGPPCIVVGVGPSGPICAPPGGPTYIADARPDVSVMLLASIGAYAVAHLAARLQERRAISLTRGAASLIEEHAAPTSGVGSRNVRPRS